MGNSKQGIYVETFIRGSLDDLWQKTQVPELHARWDLRFTEIKYLPPPDESQPQQFLYATRIGLGMRICGAGESVGQHDDGLGTRSSSLKFWSDDPKSLILSGSGYWKYIPSDGGVRFLTWYDYQIRFGPFGRVFDSIIFRPLIGWATAWSFDRLRLWIEKHIDPAVSLRSSLIHALARLTLAFIWLFHGIVPKLIFLSSVELSLIQNTGVPSATAIVLLRLLGLCETALGIATLIGWHRRWPLLASLGLLCMATLGVIATSPETLATAFNPVTLNLAAIALALIALLSGSDLPSARRCLRHPKEH